MSNTCPGCNAVVDAKGTNSHSCNDPRYLSTSYPLWFPGGLDSRLTLCFFGDDPINHLDPLVYICKYS